MKRRLAVLVSVILAGIFLFAGCVPGDIPMQSGSVPPPASDHTADISPEATPIAAQTPEPSPTDSEEEALLDTQILDTGTTLRDAVSLLNMDESQLNSLLGEEIEQVRDNYEYREYSYGKKAITIGCYLEKTGAELSSAYIDFDRDKISFFGITAASGFDDVMDALGEATLYEIQDGLPGLVTYELRYTIKWHSNEYTLRIYSYSKDCSDGIWMSVVTKNLPRYRSIRITPEQISRYFSMTKAELIAELGEDYISDSDTSLSYYENYGVSFDYDKQGKQLYKIDFDQTYQINGVRQGYSLDRAMEILGRTRKYTVQTSEDGPIYYIQYKYKNFIFQVEHFYSEGWGTIWTIKSPEYDGFW